MLNGASAHSGDWRELDHFLQSRDYTQAAKLLHEMQVINEAAGNPVAAETAATVRQICLACSQCRAEIDWHQQAGQTAEQREQQLRNYVAVMLERVNSDWVRGQASLPRNLITSPLFSLQSNGKIGLRQRLQKLLAWGKRAFLLAIEESMPLYTEPTVLPALPVSHESSQNDIKLTLSATEQAQIADIPIVKPLEESEVARQMPEQASIVRDVDRQNAVRPMPEGTTDESDSPTLTVYCLGAFQVYQDDQPVKEWPSNKGQAIFKYLIMHRARPISKEVLMELFWPEAAPDAARNNLNVAIYGLRRALRTGRANFSHVVFQNDCYLLNPELQIWVDVEEFTQHLTIGQRLEQAGDQAQAVQEYRAAEALYLGEFLAEDRYEDWPLPQRQRLQDDYIRLLDRLSQYYLEQQDYELCSVICNKLLAIDACQEEAHRRLMRCYSHQGHLHLALRQYHLCVEVLARELDVRPSAPTAELHTQIRRGKPI